MKRNTAVDFLKVIALFHMVFDHAYLTLLNSPTPLLLFFYELVPLCPALFLFLSGYSLAISNGYKNLKKRLLSAFCFIFLSFFFFYLEHGIQLPHLLFASGILNTIGINILLITWVGNSSKRDFLSFFLLILFCSSYLILRIYKLELFPFTTGYEPLFPTLIFGIIGFMWGTLLEKNRNILFSIKTVVLSVSIIIFVTFSVKYGPFKSLYTDVGRYIIPIQFKKYSGVSNPVSFYTVSIWNFDLLSFFYSLSFILIIFSVLEYLSKVKYFFLPNWFLLPAQYLILNYILHLGIIAFLFSFFWKNSLTCVPFLFAYFFIILSLYTVNFFVSLIGKKLKRK